MIWRRLLVPAQATVAELHAVVLTVFGWGGEYMHRFCIQGTEYGIYQVCGPWFRDNTRAVRLGERGPARRGEIQLRVQLLRRLAGRSTGRADPPG
ncbi:MAG: hypothetical protein JO287_05570 [Pseudonocardiales bacterium]|nr:hypothetical protein [Pseudonocardiales bacterium]